MLSPELVEEIRLIIDRVCDSSTIGYKTYGISSTARVVQDKLYKELEKIKEWEQQNDSNRET